MKRNMILVCVAVVCLTLVGGTLMANDSAFRSPNQPAYDAGPIYSFEQIQYTANFSTLQDVSAYVVTTSTDATQVGGRISDCCVPGDFYRLGIIARRNEAGFSTDFVVDGTSNNCDANPDFAVTPCAADVYGPDCVVTPAAASRLPRSRCSPTMRRADWARRASCSSRRTVRSRASSVPSRADRASKR